MVWRTFIVVALLVAGPPVALAGAPSGPLADTEGRLMARIQKEADPVKKSKCMTRLARIKLQQAIEAYEHGNIQQGVQFAQIYMGRVKDSWQLLKNCGRNAARDVRGFKELDIELREDARLVDDLTRRVSYLDRGPIEQTEKELEVVHAEVLHALFPAARAQEATKPAGKMD